MHALKDEVTLLYKSVICNIPTKNHTKLQIINLLLYTTRLTVKCKFCNAIFSDQRMLNLMNTTYKTNGYLVPPPCIYIRIRIFLHTFFKTIAISHVGYGIAYCTECHIFAFCDNYRTSGSAAVLTVNDSCYSVAIRNMVVKIIAQWTII